MPSSSHSWETGPCSSRCRRTAVTFCSGEKCSRGVLMVNSSVGGTHYPPTEQSPLPTEAKHWHEALASASDGGARKAASHDQHRVKLLPNARVVRCVDDCS